VVVVAANGYPGAYVTDTPIRGLERAGAVEGVQIFHAGTRRDGERLLAAGGRVLNIAARGKTLTQAQERAYAAVAKIDWPGGFYRPDIGWRALAREKLQR
jgi:phosphoribosylamine--glycine ligase